MNILRRENMVDTATVIIGADIVPRGEYAAVFASGRAENLLGDSLRKRLANNHIMDYGEDGQNNPQILRGHGIDTIW